MTYPRPEAFLTEQAVETVLASVEAPRSARDVATAAYIRAYEGLVRQHTLGELATADFLKQCRVLDQCFCDEYGDWVHHANPFLDRFYESLNERFARLVTERKS